jgi:hypothetical protein
VPTAVALQLGSMAWSEQAGLARGQVEWPN